MRLLGVSGVRVLFVAVAKVLEWMVDDNEERSDGFLSIAARASKSAADADICPELANRTTTPSDPARGTEQVPKPFVSVE